MLNATDIRFEKLELNCGKEVIRLIAFGQDEPNMGKFVVDILEIDADREDSQLWLGQVAAYNYAGVPVSFWDRGVAKTLEDYDLGRCRKDESKIVRALQQMEVTPF